MFGLSLDLLFLVFFLRLFFLHIFQLFHQWVKFNMLYFSFTLSRLPHFGIFVAFVEEAGKLAFYSGGNLVERIVFIV